MEENELSVARSKMGIKPQSDSWWKDSGLYTKEAQLIPGTKRFENMLLARDNGLTITVFVANEVLPNWVNRDDPFLVKSRVRRVSVLMPSPGQDHLPDSWPLTILPSSSKQ